MASTSPVTAPGALDVLLRRAAAKNSKKRWRALLAPYEGADNLRSIIQLCVTLVLYGVAWVVLLWTVEVSYWLTALVALPAGGLAVRLVVLQHDCGHGSFFTSRRACDAVGRLIGVPVMVPYDYWRSTHAGHHSHSGNLDRRTGGDVDTLTVEEYEAQDWWGRARYWVVRNPFMMIGVLIMIQFVLIHRFPLGMPRSRRREWRSVWWVNAALVAILAGIWLFAGAELLLQVLIVQGMVMLVAGSFAAWLNHVQHQFEDAYWHRAGEWDFFEAGLRGASWLDLPGPLRWLTASIGLHHVHHLSTRIPNYRLQRCHDENPELWSVHRITLREGFRALHLALWDERSGRLISFGEYRRMGQGAT